MHQWWCIKWELLTKFGFNLQYILQLFKPKFIKQIWQMVVAATLWSIWLGRNDSIFNKAKTSNKILQTLIFHRVAKWGGVAKLVKFTHIPLWQINPVGTIHVHHYLEKSK